MNLKRISHRKFIRQVDRKRSDKQVKNLKTSPLVFYTQGHDHISTIPVVAGCLLEVPMASSPLAFLNGICRQITSTAQPNMELLTTRRGGQ